MSASELRLVGISIVGRGQVFAVKLNAKEAARLEADVVVACFGSGDLAFPSYGKGVHVGGFGGERGGCVDVGIDTLGKRLGAGRIVDVGHVELGETGLDAGLAIDCESRGWYRVGIVGEELGADNVVDCGAGKFFLQAFENGDRVGGLTVVIAEQDFS